MTRVEWLWLVLLLGVYAPALAALASVWSSLDYYSHGFLVPLVSLWAAHRESARWRELPRCPDRRGLLPVVASLPVYVAGQALEDPTLAGLALVASLAGAIWWLRGFAWLRALAFPVAYLLFAVPLPAAWLGPVILRLQLAVSSGAVALLHALELPVVQEGNVILLPAEQALFVAEACSGITSIVTLTPLAVLLAALTLRGLARRALLVAAVVPVAMFGNLARVVVTVLVALRVGVEAATEGSLHDSSGLLTFLLSCGLLIGLDFLLQQRPASGGPAGSEAGGCATGST